MKRKHKQKPVWQRKTAVERIRTLFSQADKAYEENPSFSNRYVALARKISMKCKIKLTSPQKRKYCKHCQVYLRPGGNCRVRSRPKMMIYYCLKCKKHMRILYKK